MATLSDVTYALNSQSQSVVQKLSKDTTGIVEYKEGVKLAEKEWYIFKLVDNNKKGGVYIPNVDDVINPKTGQVERIRLLSGVNSIWQKDQKDLTPEYIRQNMRNIEFPRGVKIRRIPNYDKTLLEFMRVSNFNVGNPKRIPTAKFEFFEFDPALAEKEAYKKEEFEIEMAILAKEQPVEAMKKHAAFLGIQLKTEFGPKTDEGIRQEYVVNAKRNPEHFKRTLGTPQVAIAWLVKRAIAESLIDINREPGRIFWAKDGGLIGAYPQTENPEKYLTDLAMTNTQEGQLFKSQLEKIIT